MVDQESDNLLRFFLITNDGMRYYSHYTIGMRSMQVWA